MKLIGAMPIMMPLMIPAKYNLGPVGGNVGGPSKKLWRGSFSADGRFRLVGHEVLTIPSNNGCLVEITADENGNVSEVNICATRDREVKLTFNGEIKFGA